MGFYLPLSAFINCIYLLIILSIVSDVQSLPDFNHSVTRRRNNECLRRPTEGQVSNDVVVAYSRPVRQTALFSQRSTRLAICLLYHLRAFNQTRPAPNIQHCVIPSQLVTINYVFTPKKHLLLINIHQLTKTSDRKSKISMNKYLL